jgi:hypothetical protein
MVKVGLSLAAALLSAAWFSGCSKPGGSPGGGGTGGGTATGPSKQPPVARGMAAFQSEQELVEYLKRRVAPARRRARMGFAPSEPAPPAAPAAAPTGADEAAADSVTNVQHAGVDEGGIVKLAGDHLVVLRRGRLFTINVGDDALTPISSVDAFGPDIDPGGAWYDEMLVSSDTVVVIGYSYRRGGTEIGLFDLDRAGKLAYRATYHLRSNDYYSSRNYASRLLGNKLVFYTPLHLHPDPQDPLRRFPAIRRWHRAATEADFRRIASPTRVYKPLDEPQSLALHSVTTCDLSRRELDCTASGVMGPPGRVFYVSPSSVYVWMTEWRAGQPRPSSSSLAYRLPLDGGAPTALRVAGSPVDQFSFLESADEHLNVLVRAGAAGDAMWSSEVTTGDVALMRVPLASFSGDGARVQSSRYRALPKPPGHTFQNRFVGQYVLYGSGSGWGRPQSGSGNLYAYRFAGGGEPSALELEHGIDRIESLGGDAIAIGSNGQDLHFSPIALGQEPRAAESYVRKQASQGELRSHGFFYKPRGEGRGLIGLPIRASGRPGHEHLVHGSASVLFLQSDALRLSELGALSARPGVVSDGCRASCVDWYGNARPLFLGGRIFALLGYELVEGRLDGGEIRERRRQSFGPEALAARR